MSSVMRTLAERLQRENADLRAQVERLQAAQVVATVGYDGDLHLAPGVTDLGDFPRGTQFYTSPPSVAPDGALIGEGTKPGTAPVAQAGQTLTDAQIDALLEPVLRASGSSLRHYSLHKPRADMRTALRAALAAQPARVAVELTDRQIIATLTEEFPRPSLVPMLKGSVICGDFHKALIAAVRVGIAKFCELNGITPGDGRA